MSQRTKLSAGVLAVVAMIAMVAMGNARAATPLFKEDFSNLSLGALPDDFLVYEGQFAVREDGGNKFMELPGAPLESFAVMFGPANNGKEEWGARARIFGTGKGRKFPVIGISLNGFGGYRLQLAPAKKAIELVKGDEVEASVPYEWESGAWIHLRVQIRKDGERAWKIQGKAWKDGAPEPSGWLIAWNETEEPPPGRSAVWGMPYSGTPIRFDDLTVVPAEK